MQGKEAGFETEPHQCQPKQWSQRGLVTHRAKVPTSSTPRQHTEKCEQTHRPCVRGCQIEPAGSAGIAMLPVEGNQKISANREQLPTDQKMQTVGDCQHESNAEH